MEREAPTLEPEASESVPGPSAADVREAHKLNHLVDEGEVLASEVSKAEATELDRMVGELFDPNYVQNIHHPEIMQEKTGGQYEEDAAVSILNESQSLFHAEKAPEGVDHGPQKGDILLSIEGEEEKIPIQLTSRVDEGVIEKFRRLPERTIPVILPGVRRVLEAARGGNPADLRGISHEFLKQVLLGMRERKPYQELYGRLSTRLARGRQ